MMAKRLLGTRGLVIKSNWQVFPVESRGIDFLGYVFYHNYVLLRKSIALLFKQKVRRLQERWEYVSSVHAISMIMSYLGWCKYANSNNLIRSIIRYNIFWIIKKKSVEAGIRNPLQGRS